MARSIPLVQRRAPPDTAWRWSWLLAAPHRLCFFAAALMLGASALWWAAVMAARVQGWAWPWAVAPALAHGLWMGYGFMPLFFAGFLFTAGPRWLAMATPRAAALRGPVVGLLGGWAAFAAGAHLHALLAAAGLGAAALGWSALVLRFALLLRGSPVEDKTHARIVAWACGGIALSMGAAALGLALQQALLVRAALQAGLWTCVAVVYVAVSHRMIPFFTAAALPVLDAWRPMWLLWTLVAALAFELPFRLAEPLWGPLPAPLRALQAGVEAPVAALLLWLAWRWGLVQSLKVRLLAMLHLGFLWLGIAFALNALSHGLMAASAGEVSLGLAPLHALTMGFFGSTMVAMVTRVTCGHGGRALVADDFVWRLFWLLQLAVAARVLAALWPAAATALLPLAALAWCGAMVAWALRYGRWYGMQRADGRPG
ncbi:MAG: NnrS family protein [Pseudomonadota bacterium]